MIEKNRHPNFKLSDTKGALNDSGTLTSTMKSQFDYKGTPQRIQLDPEIKKDLRSSHFQMGTHPIEYLTSTMRNINN